MEQYEYPPEIDPEEEALKRERDAWNEAAEADAVAAYRRIAADVDAFEAARAEPESPEDAALREAMNDAAEIAAREFMARFAEEEDELTTDEVDELRESFDDLEDLFDELF